MAEILYDHYEIITEIRKFIINTVDGVEDKQVIRDTQNFAALPKNAITIAVIYDSEMDYSVNVYEPDKGRTLVQSSMEVLMQIDFYGDKASERSRTLAQLWRNGCAYERLEKCKPLYVQSRQRSPYINESNLYENRYILELTLQYNPVVGYDQDYVDTAEININPIGG